MNPRLLELATRHGELKARIAMQRQALAVHFAPLETALGVADRAVSGVDWLKAHPAAIVSAVAALVVLRPRRAWRWAKRGVMLWRGWQGLRNSLLGGR